MPFSPRTRKLDHDRGTSPTPNLMKTIAADLPTSLVCGWGVTGHCEAEKGLLATREERKKAEGDRGRAREGESEEGRSVVFLNWKILRKYLFY